MASTNSAMESPKESTTVDLFSLLPDDLLMHIISFLPIKYAVFTSILSKRWSCLWCYAGNSLVFDDEGICYKKSGFPEFVDRVLRLYKVPQLKKFTLLCNRDTNVHGRCHKSWIDRALKQLKPTEAGIYLREDLRYQDGTTLPLQVFNSEVLQVLHLQCSAGLISYPDTDLNLCLPNLKVLHIWAPCLHWNPQLFNKCFSGAPRLEEAFLGSFMSRFNIDENDKRYYVRAPSLKRLRLRLRRKFQQMNLLLMLRLLRNSSLMMRLTDVMF